MFKSLRTVYISLEIVTIILVVFFAYYILFILQKQIKNEYLESHIAEINKTDIIINNIITENIELFNKYVNLTNKTEAIELLPDFSDIYFVNNNFIITKIYKKDHESKIFIGYNIGKSRIKEFLIKPFTDTIKFSPIYRSPENDKLSIYIIEKKENGYIIGRMGIELIENNLKSIAQYANSIIIISTNDGYILLNTKKSFWLSVLPDKNQTEIFLEHNYLYTRAQSSILDNDIVILTPMTTVYIILSQIRQFYPLFITIICLVIIIKILIQMFLMIYPIEKFVYLLKNWKIEDRLSDIPKKIIKFKEMKNLYETFLNKTLQIKDAHEKLKQNEDELKKTKKYLKNIIDSMPSILISIDNSYIIKEWNTAAVHYTGIESSQALGKKIWEIAPYLEKYKNICQKVLDDKQSLDLEKEIIHQKDNHIKKISFFPLTQNGITGMAIRMDDITEFEKIQQELIQSQKMETIGVLAGGLAHDFNNVLAGIVGTLSIMRLKLKKESNFLNLKEKIWEYVSIMDESATRATEMANQLLSLSKKQKINFTRIDFNKSIKNILNICKNTFEKSIEMNVSYYPGHAILEGDPTQIEQAILNLCVNASHAMTIMRTPQDKQGGKLEISLTNIVTDYYFVKSHPEVIENMSYWCLSIHDTGVGIEQNLITKIFDPFFSTKDKNKGSGLGLSMVYNIIKLHKGFIDVYSEPGTGTTFHIFLPVYAGIIDINEKNIAENLFPGEGEILVIDDEEIIRVLANEILASCGYHVDIAQDGVEGIKIISANPYKYDLVILDMAMPKKSGLETYQELKKINPKIKVLISSGFSEDERVKKTISLGANGFIQKPYTLNKLSEAVKKILIK